MNLKVGRRDCKRIVCSLQAGALRVQQLEQMMLVYTSQQEALALTVVAWQARFGSLLVPQRSLPLAAVC